MKTGLWTDEEIEFLRDNYAIKSQIYCAQKLNRSRCGIANKAKNLSLKNNLSNPAYQEDRFRDHCTKNSMTPLWNKWNGTKGKSLVSCNNCDYEWHANPGNCYSNGAGCPACNKGISPTKEAVKTYCEKLNLSLRSHSFKLQSDKIKVKCKNCTFQRVVKIGCLIQANRRNRVNYCPKCSGNSKKGLTDYNKLARTYSGKHIGSVPINTQMKTQWACFNGHKIFKSYNAVQRQKSLCSICSPQSRGEEIARFIFEKMTSLLFPSLCPKILEFEGGRLELDGYNEESKTAFEYNGLQHYKKCYLSNREFEDLKKRDEHKYLMCKKNRIKLLIIKESVPGNPDVTHLLDLIKDFCVKRHLFKNDVSVLEVANFISTLSSDYRKDRFRKKAKKLNLQLLSHCYLGSQSKVLVRCLNCKYERDITYNALDNASKKDKNKFCPQCNGIKAYDYDRIMSLCKSLCLHPGILPKKIHATIKFSTMCIKCGGETIRRAMDLQRYLDSGRKMGCRVCNGGPQLITDERVQNALIKLKLSFVSGNISSLKNKIIVKCNKCYELNEATIGHFLYSAETKNKDSLCKKCSGKRKPTISEIQDYLEKYGFGVTDKIYVNGTTPMNFIYPNGLIRKCGWKSFRTRILPAHLKKLEKLKKTEQL